MKLVDAGPEGFVEYELYIAPGFSNLNSKVHRSK
jgi:acyl-coenzyme A thioesterase 13